MKMRLILILLSLSLAPNVFAADAGETNPDRDKDVGAKTTDKEKPGADKSPKDRPDHHNGDHDKPYGQNGGFGGYGMAVRPNQNCKYAWQKNCVKPGPTPVQKVMAEAGDSSKLNQLLDKLCKDNFSCKSRLVTQANKKLQKQIDRWTEQQANCLNSTAAACTSLADKIAKAQIKMGNLSSAPVQADPNASAYSASISQTVTNGNQAVYVTSPNAQGSQAVNLNPTPAATAVIGDANRAPAATGAANATVNQSVNSAVGNAVNNAIQNAVTGGAF